MKKLSLKGMISLAVIILLSGCGAVMKTTGTLAGKLLTQKTADLSKASVQVQFVRNVYPAAVNSIEVEYLGKDWQDGGNMVTINFLKREGIGMYAIDGQVFIDGSEVPHLANGFYGKWTGREDFTPKMIRVVTSSGQEAEFLVTPPPPIRIVSVNGQKDTADVNLNSPLTLELESPQADSRTEFSVSLLSNIMNIRTFIESGIFKYKNKIIIPAALWKNSMSPVPPVGGESWLRIERFNVNTAIIKGVGATQVVGTAIDCVPVRVTGELEETRFGTVDEQGLTVSETIKNKTGEMNIEFSKPNAFLGRPMNSGKKFAVASFTVRATRLQQSRTSSSSNTTYTSTHKITTTTTTTTTRTFPTLPDAYWDELVARLYKDFESILQENYNITLIPVEQVVQAPSYASLEPITDQISMVEVEKSYKNTKNLIPTTFSAIVKNISSTFASDRIDARLLRELDVDGLIAVTIDLEMPWEEFSLSPRLSIRISGAPNGYKAGPTIYLQGLVSGNGLPLDEAKMDAKYLMNLLPNVIRQKDLMSALNRGFKAMAEREKSMDYTTLWSLK